MYKGPEGVTRTQRHAMSRHDMCSPQRHRTLLGFQKIRRAGVSVEGLNQQPIVFELCMYVSVH